MKLLSPGFCATESRHTPRQPERTVGSLRKSVKTEFKQISKSFGKQLYFFNFFLMRFQAQIFLSNWNLMTSGVKTQDFDAFFARAFVEFALFFVIDCSREM